jgi:2-polyprenyl-6-methoxyphenol hydroxylase-like FAD-dependent oxidoreductase
MLRPYEHALVIGGSVAGLLAARVLADHFDRVTVVERDHYPAGPEPRKGVPQARHVHILLLRGQQILEQLFPGLEAELAEAGAPAVDWAADCPTLTPAGWGPRFASDLIVRTCSRDLLEWHLHQRLVANPKIHFIEDCDVTGLISAETQANVLGVRIRLRNGERADSVLSADLVVDASGRASRAPEWLEALGYARPHETVINSFLGYSSRVYQRPPEFATDWKGLLIRSNPPATTRGGGIYPIEEDRWLVTLGGAARDYPPTDEAGFLEFARSFPNPLLYDALRQAQPLSPITGYQRTENRLRHFEQMRARPEGFVVLGDAACAFNPVYGQGMTVAALGAITLDRCLREQRRRSADSLAGLAGRFQKALARVNTTPWLFATGQDARIPGTEGAQLSRASKPLRWYMEQLTPLAVQEPKVYKLLLEVGHMLKPPTVLFVPGIALRVLKQAWNVRRRSSAHDEGRRIKVTPSLIR